MCHNAGLPLTLETSVIDADLNLLRDDIQHRMSRRGFICSAAVWVVLDVVPKSEIEHSKKRLCVYSIYRDKEHSPSFFKIDIQCYTTSAR
jgi:hypothetical protein